MSISILKLRIIHSLGVAHHAHVFELLAQINVEVMTDGRKVRHGEVPIPLAPPFYSHRWRTIILRRKTFSSSSYRCSASWLHHNPSLVFTCGNNFGGLWKIQLVMVDISDVKPIVYIYIYFTYTVQWLSAAFPNYPFVTSYNKVLLVQQRGYRIRTGIKPGQEGILKLPINFIIKFVNLSLELRLWVNVRENGKVCKMVSTFSWIPVITQNPQS